jgi:hypothetical protein
MKVGQCIPWRKREATRASALWKGPLERLIRPVRPNSKVRLKTACVMIAAAIDREALPSLTVATVRTAVGRNRPRMAQVLVDNVGGVSIRKLLAMTVHTERVTQRGGTVRVGGRLHSLDSRCNPGAAVHYLLFAGSCFVAARRGGCRRSPRDFITANVTYPRHALTPRHRHGRIAKRPICRNKYWLRRRGRRRLARGNRLVSP